MIVLLFLITILVVFIIVWRYKLHAKAGKANISKEDANKTSRLVTQSGQVEQLINATKSFLEENTNDHIHETFKLMKSSAELGDIGAQFELGMMYYNGVGVDQNKLKAIKWYKMSAEQGFEEAQFALGLIYMTGDCVVEDKREALKWYTMAANSGFAPAQYNLGLIFYSGDGVVQDKRKAFMWYKLAAEHGLSSAQLNLGQMYRNGEGINQDMREAYKLFKLAAEQGEPGAQYLLGLMYAIGQGTSLNYEQAYFWFLLACERVDDEYIDDTIESCNLASKQLNLRQRKRIERQVDEYNKGRVRKSFVFDKSCYCVEYF